VPAARGRLHDRGGQEVTLRSTSWRSSTRLFGLAGLGLIGCGDAVPVVSEPVSVEPRRTEDTAVTDIVGVAWLTPVEHAVRASLALREVRPTVDELERVRSASDPEAAVETLVDEWIHTPEFAGMIRQMHGDQLLVLNDANPGNRLPQVGPLKGWDQTAIFESMSGEPLRLIERVVVEGRPYTEIVTADWMMTDPIISAAFGPSHDPDGPVWQESQWTDGRPQAGILSSSQVWRRHLSNASNFNRARANFVISRTLLCDEIATRAVDFADAPLPTTSDTEAVAHALMVEPTCVSCHQSLDPLASTLWGFKRNLFTVNISDAYDLDCRPDQVVGAPEEGVAYGDDACYPLRFYNAENEGLWKDFGMRAPGYYGAPVSDLKELGGAVARDPRFVSCAVKRFVSYLEQVAIEDVPDEVVPELRASFDASGLDARELARSIVLSDAFRTRSAGPDDPWIAGMQTLRPTQLSNVLYQRTGFRFVAEPHLGKSCDPYCKGEVDLLTTEDYGYRSLLGGIDGKYQPQQIHVATPTRGLAIARATAEAAAWVVRNEGELPRAERNLLTEVDDLGDGQDLTAVRAQLAVLHERLLDEDVTDLELDGTQALFEAELARSGPDATEAWQLVISALLRDPGLLYY